jgi:hypothetical protein
VGLISFKRWAIINSRTMEKQIRRAIPILASGWFFVFTVTIFAVEAVVLAISSRFPMAFDEAYHFELIEFFTHRLSPIVTSQPSSSFVLGAVIHDPSILYHYLLSFPLRFMELFTSNPVKEVIMLRLINVFIACCSLIVMKKLLRLIGLSEAFSNTVLIIFALTPIVTVLSAQINYDNLLILVVTSCLYQTIKFIKKLKQKEFSTSNLLLLILLCMTASLVKYTFLPFLLGIIIIVGYQVYKFNQTSKQRLKESFLKSFKKISGRTKVILLVLNVVAGLFFIRIYGVNLVEYHSPAPACNQILSIADCSEYYAWDNDYVSYQNKLAHPDTHLSSLPAYTSYWIKINMLGIFGEIMPLVGPFFDSPIFYTLVATILAVGIIFSIAFCKKILRFNKELGMLLIIVAVYVIFLFSRNYHDYIHLGQATAIDGRYMVPILIYLYSLLGLEVKYALSGERHKSIKLPAKVILTIFIIVLFLFNGGFIDYLSHVTSTYGHLQEDDYFSLRPT